MARPAGARALDLGYQGTVCARAREALVKESERTVTVTLLDPRADPTRACIALARPGCAKVRLGAPLGTRRVVDGARDAFRQRKRGAERLPFARFGRCRPVPVRR